MINDTKTHLGFKIFISIITIVHLLLFIFNFINIDYDINNIFYIIRLVLVIMTILLFSLTILFNKPTIVFGILNIMIIIFSTILILTNNLEFINNIKEEIECSKDNITVNITKRGNNVEYLSYTYTYDIKDIDGAKNFVNKFDKQYAGIDNVYSEVDIADEVTIRLIYKMNKIDKNKLYKIEHKYLNKYSILEGELTDYTCKKKN